MNLIRHVMILFAAVLVLLPACGCGKVIMFTEPPCEGPCCPCGDPYPADGEEGAGCESQNSLFQQFTLEKQLEDSAADFAEDPAKALLEVFKQDMLMAQFRALGGVLRPPPRSIAPSLAFICSYRL